MDTLEKLITGLLVAGAGLMGYIAGQANSGLKAFDRGDKAPAVIREYNLGSDNIYVQESPNSTDVPQQYIPLDKYLREIEDEGERELEKAAILNVVGWYD